MKFNLVYSGPSNIFEIRRDLFLFIKYALESCGHKVSISHNSFANSALNIVIGAYFLKNKDIHRLMKANIPYAIINTEIIANDMLNFQPNKCDFLGDYLPLMQRAQFTWDIILENMPEHERYETNTHFLRFGYVPELDEIRENNDKTYDCYFFGLHSAYRVSLLKKIEASGMRVISDVLCPYFMRNDRIEHSKIQLAMRQDNVFTHANALRISYLANNGCAILSEKESDPAGYLNFTRVCNDDDFIDNLADLVRNDSYKKLQEETRAKFMQIRMKTYMEKLLSDTFRQ